MWICVFMFHLCFRQKLFVQRAFVCLFISVCVCVCGCVCLLQIRVPVVFIVYFFHIALSILTRNTKTFISYHATPNVLPHPPPPPPPPPPSPYTLQICLWIIDRKYLSQKICSVCLSIPFSQCL